MVIRLPGVIEALTAEDVDDALRLSTLAGWNQTRDDWERFRRLAPRGVFGVRSGGRVVATAAGFAFGEVGWVAMVLTEPDFRGRGLGSKLTAHTVEQLRHAGCASVRLDASPEGRPIYEKLGFVEDFELQRWVGAPRGSAATGGGVRIRAATAADRAGIVVLDRLVARCDRWPLLEALVRTASGAALVALDDDGGVIGFGMSRVGRAGISIGPLAAYESSVADTLATRLVETVHPASRGSLVVDVAVGSWGERWAEGNGFRPQRPLTRMTLGRRLDPPGVAGWLSSGPEKG